MVISTLMERVSVINDMRVHFALKTGENQYYLNFRGTEDIIIRNLFIRELTRGLRWDINRRFRDEFICY
jgi:hypothetical protein